MKETSKKPLISVIMPVYNAENYLEEAINSILNQTLKDFEFLIINDKSLDNSKKIIEKYKKKDKRIIFLENKENLGVAKTRTKGLNIAKGKYIATFDADDVSLPKRFEIQVNYLESHPRIFLIGGSGIIIDEDGNKLGVFKKFNNPGKIEKKLVKSNPIINSSTMFRNQGDLFYRDKFDGADEHDLFLRLISEGKKVTNIPEFLVKYRINPTSISFRKRAKQEYFVKKIQEFYLQRKKFGKDRYDEFNPEELKGLKEDADFEKIKLNSRILGEFQEGNLRLTRKLIKQYFKKYKKEKRLIIYYIASFLPKKLIRFIKKLF